MLVTVEKFAKFPHSPLLAQIQTPIGRAAVVWCGDPKSEPGAYYVEWTVEATVTWGVNAKPASIAEAGVGPGGHCVVLRGRIDHLEDGVASMDLGGASILLDVEGFPDSSSGTWVELHLAREKVELYPYQL